MDNLLLVVGALAIVISIIAISRHKSAETEEEYLEDIDSLEDMMELTDEEMAFLDGLSDDDRLDIHSESKTEERFSESRFEIELEEKEELVEAEDREIETIDYRETVAEMYRGGMPPADIAKQMKMGVREVEIILKVKRLLK